MNALDWAIVVAVVLSVLLAVAQGFLFAMFSLAGTVVGFLLAARGYGRLAPWFLPYVKTPAIADLAGFLTIFFGVILLAGMAGRVSRWVFRQAGLQWFDRALGAAFGLVRGIVIATVLVMSLVAFSPGIDLVAQSRLGHYFLVFDYGVSWLAPSELRGRLKQGMAKVNAAVLQQQDRGDPQKASGQKALEH